MVENPTDFLATKERAPFALMQSECYASRLLRLLLIFALGASWPERRRSRRLHLERFNSPLVLATRVPKVDPIVRATSRRRLFSVFEDLLPRFDVISPQFFLISCAFVRSTVSARVSNGWTQIRRTGRVAYHPLGSDGLRVSIGLLAGLGRVLHPLSRVRPDVCCTRRVRFCPVARLLRRGHPSHRP